MAEEKKDVPELDDELSDDELESISGGRNGRGARPVRRPEMPRPTELDEYA